VVFPHYHTIIETKEEGRTGDWRERRWLEMLLVEGE